MFGWKGKRQSSITDITLTNNHNDVGPTYKHPMSPEIISIYSMSAFVGTSLSRVTALSLTESTSPEWPQRWEYANVQPGGKVKQGRYQQVWSVKWNEKCNDLKCIQKPTHSRLSLTHHANKSSRWADKNIKWSESPWNQSAVGKEKVYGGNDLPKSQVFSSEWKTE